MDEEITELRRRLDDLENQIAANKKVVPIASSASLDDVINKLNEIISKFNIKLR